jgi:hypothetical protein
MRKITLIEQKESIYTAVIEGVKLGLTYPTIAKNIGVHNKTLNEWLKKSYEITQRLQKLGLSEEEIDHLSAMGTGMYDEKGMIKVKYGPRLSSLVEKEGFWLRFGYDIRKADGYAEGRMLGVIHDAAIGNHALVETKRKSVTVANPEGDGDREVAGTEVTTVTKELRPQWQAAAWLLERKWPEKYAQRRIVEGELPKDIPYEVFMTAKTLLQLPKIELDRIISALRQKMQHPRVSSGPALLEESKKAPGNGGGAAQ